MRRLAPLIVLCLAVLGLAACAPQQPEEEEPSEETTDLLALGPNEACAATASPEERKDFLLDNAELTDRELARVCPVLFVDADVDGIDDPTTGRVGQPLELSPGDLELRVLVGPPLDLAEGGQRATGPRMIGIPVTVANGDGGEYEGTVAERARLFAGGATPLRPLRGGPATCQPGPLVTREELPENRSLRGCLPFALPADARARGFELTLYDTDSASATGVWRLPDPARPRSSAPARRPG